jgi:hypothetical protein
VGLALGFCLFSYSTPWFTSSSTMTSSSRIFPWRRLPLPYRGPLADLCPGQLLLSALRGSILLQSTRASRAALGALSAARELLRHPPSSTASLGAMKQWRDDVDRLLGMAHSGSARPKPHSSRRQHEASTSVRSPESRLEGG